MKIRNFCQELKPEYVDMAKKRIRGALGMLVEIKA